MTTLTGAVVVVTPVDVVIGMLDVDVDVGLGYGTVSSEEVTVRG